MILWWKNEYFNIDVCLFLFLVWFCFNNYKLC